MEMVLPGLIGYWLDQRLGTVALFAVLGFGFGLTLGIVHLVQLGESQHTTSHGSGAVSETRPSSAEQDETLQSTQVDSGGNRSVEADETAADRPAKDGSDAGKRDGGTPGGGRPGSEEREAGSEEPEADNKQ